MIALFFLLYVSILLALLYVLISINYNIKKIISILKEDMCPNTFRHSFNSLNESNPFLNSGYISPLSSSLPSLPPFSPRSSDGLLFDSHI